MRIDGSVTMPAAPDRVYARFTDPAVLQKATPGCKSLVPAGEGEYRAELFMGVAAIKGTYTGKLRLAEQRPPEHFKLLLEGSGTPGFVSGSAEMDFSAAADGNTLVRYVWDVQVGGLIAGVGQRVLGGVAKLLIGQFFQAMSRELQGG